MDNCFRFKNCGKVVWEKYCWDFFLLGMGGWGYIGGIRGENIGKWGY